jgi:hypothetical protein
MMMMMTMAIMHVRLGVCRGVNVKKNRKRARGIPTRTICRAYRAGERKRERLASMDAPVSAVIINNSPKPINYSRFIDFPQTGMERKKYIYF